MWELDYKESWVPKNWCFWTMVLKKTLESPLDCKEVQAVDPKGDQSCVFIGRTMLKLKLQYFGHLMWRADSFEKTLMLGKIEGRRRRGQQRMRWLDDINGHGFGWTSAVGDGQGGLACCGSWGRKESDITEQLNWNKPLLPPILSSKISVVPFHPFCSSCSERWNVYFLGTLASWQRY